MPHKGTPLLFSLLFVAAVIVLFQLTACKAAKYGCDSTTGSTGYTKYRSTFAVNKYNSKTVR